jgi:hypothetical protein
VPLDRGRLAADARTLPRLREGSLCENYNMKRNRQVACSTHLIITNYTE